MNRSGWLKHSWLDKDNRVVHTTMTTPGQGTILARVNLKNGSVEIIETQFADPSTTVTPIDKTHILRGAQAFENGQRPRYSDNLRWYEEATVFDTMWESDRLADWRICAICRRRLSRQGHTAFSGSPEARATRLSDT